MISERSIARSCRPAVLGRGRLIAEHTARINERVCSYKGDLTQLAARVTSSAGSGSYHASVDIDEAADLIVAHRCTCPAASRFPGPCKHAVALVLDFNTHPNLYTGWNELEHVSTSSILSDYLDRLAAAKTDRAFGSNAASNSIRLDPVLTHDNGLFVRFRVATKDSSYVIKSIGEFAGRISDGSWHSYGKRLAFVHEFEAFEPWSADLAAFICRCVQNRRAYGANHLYGHVYTSSSAAGNVGRELHLSGPEIDELISLCMGHEINFEYMPAAGGLTCKRVHVEDGNPDIALVITPVGDGSFELTRQGHMDFFSTSSHTYAAQEGVLYRCTSAFSNAASFFTSVYASDHDNLLLADSDAARFAVLALPTLEAAIPVSVPEDMNSLRATSCSLEFSLDCSEGIISCTLTAIYGDQRINVLSRGITTGNSLIRDLAAEAEARSLVIRYFPSITSGTARMPEHGADSALATLLFDGVPQMRALGTVLETDSFRRLSSSRQPRVAMHITTRNGLIDLTVSAEDLPRSELYALLDRYHRHERYHRLRDGSFLDLTTVDLERASLIVDELGLHSADLLSEHTTIPAYKAFLLDALLEHDERDDLFERYVEGFRNIDPSCYAPPSSLAPMLRPYQVEGFRWLSALIDMGFGGILADEMGLGKSVQLIAFLLAHYKETKEHVRTDAPAPSLIVCPASLVYNWKAEFEKFAPTIDVAIVAGNADERSRIRAEQGHEVLVTSYDLVRRDIASYAEMGFWCLVLDEAHYIKNHETLIARAVKTIDAKHRLALTGTPVENRLAELWSIFDFLMPGLLGSHDNFRDRYERAALDEDDEATRRLASAVAPFIMRRKKSDVLAELPDKLEQVVSTKMDEDQRRLYAAHEQALRLSLTGQAEANYRESKIQVLAELMRLRQLCCDPRLVYQDYDGGSCKLDAIVELVRTGVASQQKVLVFSQFTSYLTLIAAELEKNKISFHTLVGSTPKLRRIELVNAFNTDDTPVFLASLKAGGTGLNLTGASIVIHADPWWNAAAQNQATDRAHRIGQTRNVTVYKIIAAKSIEERIVMLQDAKANMAEQIVDGASGNLGLATLTRDDLIELLDNE